MADKSKMALALVIGGILCFLVSIGGMMYLYHGHAETFNVAPFRHGEFGNFEMFLIANGIPAAAGIVIGTALVAIGIKIGVYSN